MKYGADPNQLNQHDMNHLTYCCQGGLAELVKVLLSSSDIEIQPKMYSNKAVAFRHWKCHCLLIDDPRTDVNIIFDGKPVIFNTLVSKKLDEWKYDTILYVLVSNRDFMVVNCGIDLEDVLHNQYHGYELADILDIYKHEPDRASDMTASLLDQC
jgi:hypothetical protein